MKKILKVLAILLIILLVFAGCDKGKKDNDGNDGNNGGNTVVDNTGDNNQGSTDPEVDPASKDAEPSYITDEEIKAIETKWKEFLNQFVDNGYYLKNSDEEMKKFFESCGMEKISGDSVLNYRAVGLSPIDTEHVCTIYISGGNRSYTYDFTFTKDSSKTVDFYDVMPFGLGIFAGTTPQEFVSIYDITGEWFTDYSVDEENDEEIYSFASSDITAAMSYYNGYYFIRVEGQNGMVMFIFDELDGLVEFAVEH